MRKLIISLAMIAISLSSINAQNNIKGNVIHLTKAEFLEKVVNYEKNPNEWNYLGDKPAIIDFYANWCPPCKAIAPRLKELAVEYADEIVIYKVNVDDEKELAKAFNIRSIPTLIYAPMKGEPSIIVGGMSKEELVKNIETKLLNK